MNKIKVLAINPGSDSVKIALYENHDLIFQENIKNTIEELTTDNDLNSTIPHKIKKNIRNFTKEQYFFRIN